MLGVGVQLRGPLGPSEDFVEGLVATALRLRDAGLRSLWLTQAHEHDAMTTLAVVARVVPGLEVGTGVARMPLQHPVAAALQALTVQTVAHGRFTFGVGVSHPETLGQFGMTISSPTRYQHEYLSILTPLLRGEAVRFQGEFLTADVPAPAMPAPAPTSVLLGGSGPRTLALAGALAEGVITSRAGARHLAEVVVPLLGRAAAEAGRPPPRVVACVPVALAPVAEGRALAESAYAQSAGLRIYRELLERQQLGSVADIAVVGDEAAIERGLRALESAGVTDVAARLVGDEETIQRTMAVLGALSRHGQNT